MTGFTEQSLAEAFRFNALREIGAVQAAEFAERGFLVIPKLLSATLLDPLRMAFPRLFAGDFDTGVYPDEWYWREGMSLPDVTRHMANAWKSDLAVARLVLSGDIARVASSLAGWSGARLGQDTIWWKPPHTKSVALHQDSSFMDFLDPPLTMTCWVTLDDTSREAGTIEYIPGSHRWPLTGLPDEFHAAEDYHAQMRRAAVGAGVTPPDPIYVEVPAGSCVFHAGEVWHGSGSNVTGNQMRRSIGIHLVPEDARFSQRGGGYIYRRYQRNGEVDLDDSFFPLLWSETHERSAWIDRYCQTGRRPQPAPAADIGNGPTAAASL